MRSLLLLLLLGLITKQNPERFGLPIGGMFPSIPVFGFDPIKRALGETRF